MLAITQWLLENGSDFAELEENDFDGCQVWHLLFRHIRKRALDVGLEAELVEMEHMTERIINVMTEQQIRDSGAAGTIIRRVSELRAYLDSVRGDGAYPDFEAAAVTGLLRVLVLRCAPPELLIPELWPQHARVVQEGTLL
jgi:hypothetical protein